MTWLGRMRTWVGVWTHEDVSVFLMPDGRVTEVLKSGRITSESLLILALSGDMAAEGF